jgi:hypothetical protein
MTDHLFFLVGFCFLLTHEMDAVRCREWKILPVLNRMGEGAGCIAFTALHVPLYALLLWGLFDGADANRGLIVGLDVFFVVHMLLHIFLRDLPDNRFGSAFSWTLILGAGIFGAIDLLLIL